MKKSFKRLRDDIFTISLFILIIALVVYFFFFTPQKVSGNSMEPALHNDERLIVSKILSKDFTLNRYDIIVFKPPTDKKDSNIKRVLGLPGESIMIENNQIKVIKEGKNITIEENYLAKSVRTMGKKYIKEGEIHIIPEDSYFVMGDNRSFSIDSREYGFINKKSIEGKVLLRYWPINSFGFVN